MEYPLDPVISEGCSRFCELMAVIVSSGLLRMFPLAPVTATPDRYRNHSCRPNRSKAYHTSTPHVIILIATITEENTMDEDKSIKLFEEKLSVPIRMWKLKNGISLLRTFAPF